MATEGLAAFLRGVAEEVRLGRHAKSTRGPMPKRKYDKEHTRVATARILEARKANERDEEQ